MILVYEYMPTLAEHLFKLSPDDSRDFTPLTWDQRLKICIGAARGLDYLHTGTHHGVIHRDVKTSNILLDESFVGKISDFGLSKVENTSQLLAKSYVSTNIKGTVGYLDPDYFLSRKLSRKSDVYAFGVVLFEVLCGRPAVDPGLEEDQRSLAIWARQSIREGKLDQIIDPHLKGEISPHCLKVFVELAEKCLENQPKKRPSMAKIISGLEFALEQQERTDWSIPEEPAYGSTLSVSSSAGSEQSTSNGSKKSLKPRRLKSWRWDLLWNAAKTTKMESFASIKHLFKLSPDDSRDFTPLTWDQRLKICIGAARGLDYLHTGTHHGVIHRDVKTSNILLDENFVGKISDFGLSKVENTSQLLAKSYVSTNIKGTVGYLDPDYFLSPNEFKITRGISRVLDGDSNDMEASSQSSRFSRWLL
nr:concanavalin A-like lectin/glucanase, subgroup [Tanacetum cinerariifolium]